MTARLALWLHWVFPPRVRCDDPAERYPSVCVAFSILLNILVKRHRIYSPCTEISGWIRHLAAKFCDSGSYTVGALCSLYRLSL